MRSWILAERRDLRDLINDAWKEVYFQLGRNKSRPLNDDDFLRAHWMMYFKFSRQTGRDYIKFLLEEQFTPQRVHHKIVQPVELEEAEEQTSDADLEADDENGLDEVDSSVPIRWLSCGRARFATTSRASRRLRFTGFTRSTPRCLTI